MKRQLVCKVAEKKIWKITDPKTNLYAIITVSDMGEIDFTVTHREFPYSEALHEVARREGKRLFIDISETDYNRKEILEKTENCTKVPSFSGMSFQIYYLNP